MALMRWTAVVVGLAPPPPRLAPGSTAAPRSAPMLVIEMFNLHVPRRKIASVLFSNAYSVNNISVVACWTEMGKSLSHLVAINWTSIHPAYVCGRVMFPRPPPRVQLPSLLHNPLEG